MLSRYNIEGGRIEESFGVNGDMREPRAGAGAG